MKQLNQLGQPSLFYIYSPDTGLIDPTTVDERHASYIAGTFNMPPADPAMTAFIQRLSVGEPEAMDVYERAVWTGAEQQAEQHERDMHDRLTGLYNQQAWETMARKAMKRIDQEGGSLAFLLIDVNRFKRVNDTAGHKAGDDLLRHVAWSIQENTRHKDPDPTRPPRPKDAVAVMQRSVIGRFGGDEYAIMLQFTPDDKGGFTTLERAQKVAARLSAITPKDIGHSGEENEVLSDEAIELLKEAGVGISVGIATREADEVHKTVASLKDEADKAMQDQKEAARLQREELLPKRKRFCLTAARWLLRQSDQYDPRLHG